MIVASGACYRRLEVDRLKDFEGNGVYYAATDMEARLCARSPVVVVGAGNSAGDDRIEVRTDTQIVGLEGRETLTSVRVTGRDGDQVLRCAALFSFIGAEPASEWLSGCAALDQGGLRAHRPRP